jgi:GxxExxY protein
MNTDFYTDLHGERERERETAVITKHGDVTEKVVGAFYQVYNTLGYGFLEKVYENALAIELQSRGLKVQQQARIMVYYQGHPVGEYFADILVNDCVILELKTAEALADEHHAQILNYLKASDIEVGLLMNFGPKAEFKRKIFENIKKVPVVKEPPPF